MPNFYAHLTFARKVSERVSPELGKILQQEWESFQIGNFGPDPLYFGRSDLRHAGLKLHYGTGAAALEVYRKAIRNRRPYAVSFSAGYFLHHFLDSHLHPLVYRAMEETTLTHRSLEGEFDRLLMLEDGKTPREAFPRKKMPEEFYMMAARMTPGVSPEEFESSLENFRRVSMMLTGFSGTPVRYAVNAASRIPGAHGIRGAVLSREADPDADPWLREMRNLFEDAAQKAPEALEQFFRAVQEETEFDDLLHRDFSGKREE